MSYYKDHASSCIWYIYISFMLDQKALDVLSDMYL